VSPILAFRQQCQRKTDNLYDTYFVRRVSIYVTLALWKTNIGITPNAVSLLNLIVGLVACSLLGLGSGGALLWGISLMHLYSVLDSVDGELARLTGKSSIKGLFLEDLSAYLIINAFWIAVGWHLFQRTGMWGFAAVGCSVVAFGRNVMPAARRAILKAVFSRRPLDPGTTRGLFPPHTSPRTLARIRHMVDESLLHPTNIWVACTTAIILDTTIGHWGLWLLIVLFLGYASLVLGREFLGAVYMTWGRGLQTELLLVYENAREIPGIASQQGSCAPVMPKKRAETDVESSDR
jgi:hypothetical protein